VADADGYQPIEDYGIIGDLHTVALVGIDGSIDFCSLPRFDSPTIFAALLDAKQGGRFSIHLGLISATYLIDRKLSDAGWVG
jgi:GH15 family glucan-1,4-alpha-glucosidase